jgi:hypothetical protein
MGVARVSLFYMIVQISVRVPVQVGLRSHNYCNFVYMYALEQVNMTGSSQPVYHGACR